MISVRCGGPRRPLAKKLHAHVLSGATRLCPGSPHRHRRDRRRNQNMRLLWLLLPLAPVILATENEDKSLLWGPYRPNLYFGMRPRIPQSLMTGLLWFGTHDYQSIARA